MKPFKFKSKATVLRGINEEKSAKKTNWDRVIYLLLFLLLFISLLFYSVQKNLYVNVDGQIFTERFTVNFPEDVIVQSYFYGVGDTIEKGDTLFYYKYNLDAAWGGNGGDEGAAAAAAAANNSNNYDWYLKERIQTQKSISLKMIELQEVDDNIKRILEDLDRLKKEVYLDVYPKLELEASQLKLKSYKVDRTKLEEEIRYLKKYLSLLNSYEYKAKQADAYAASGGDNGGNAVRWGNYISPVNGIVTKISSDPKETSYKKDEVMFLSNTNKMYILAFIEQGDIQYFEEGEIIQLDFPDGLVSEGRINNFYLNTEELPAEFKKVKEREKRSVVAKIVPTSKEEQDKWLKYYMYEVRISKTKFQ